MKKLITLGILGFAAAVFTLPATALAEDEAAVVEEEKAAEAEEQAEEQELSEEVKEIEAAEAEEVNAAAEEVKVEEDEDTKRASACEAALAKCTDADAKSRFKKARMGCMKLRQCVQKCKATQRLYKGKAKHRARPGRKSKRKFGFQGAPKCLRKAVNAKKTRLEKIKGNRKACVKKCRATKRLGMKIKCLSKCRSQAQRARKMNNKKFKRAISTCKKAPICRTFCKSLYKGVQCGKARKLFFQKARKCATAAGKCKGVVFTGNEKDQE